MSTAVEVPAVPTADAAATLPAMLLRHVDSRAGAVALRVKRLGRWEEFSWADYERRATVVGLGLRELGIGTGDRVAVLSDNRPEWLFADLGTQGVGAKGTDASQHFCFGRTHCLGCSSCDGAHGRGMGGVIFARSQRSLSRRCHHRPFDTVGDGRRHRDGRRHDLERECERERADDSGARSAGGESR